MDGKEIIATGPAILTFDLTYRPKILKLEWERVPVEEYILNQMKWQNCQKLGHIKKRCPNIKICKECGKATHHDYCTRKFCINCQLKTHSPSQPNCRKYW